MLIFLAACGGTASSPSNPNPAPGGGSGGGGSAPTITLTASPATVTAGQFSTLNWASTGATSVTMSPAVPTEDGQKLALSGSAAVVPSATTTYTATATSAFGATATAMVTVTVNQPAPTITFTANPPTVVAGQPSTLTWTTANATFITIDNGIGNAAVPSGTATVKPGATTTYTLSATGPGGTSTATATISVPQLAVTLTASPLGVANGQATTLTWMSQGAVSVDIEPSVGVVGLSGSTQQKPTQTTTYVATAKDGSGNSTTASVTVAVVPSGSLQQAVKHIIFFVQENRSFDDYFGFLGQYKAGRGFTNDVDGLPANALQLDQNGTPVHSYHQQSTCVENTSPSWNPSWGAWNNGKMDGFVRVKDQPSTIDPMYHRVMGYYNQDDLPFYYELATQFATSDRFFESVMAGTIPNRMYLFTGTSFGHIYPDPPPSGGWQQKTIFELLNQFGINWRYYYQDNSIFLGQFQAWSDPAISSRVFNITDWYKTLASATADDDLPPVIFIERASAELQLDEHPDNNTQAGAARVQQILTALLNSAAWKSSVFILTYDEFGGLYDHVPIQPMAAPDNIAPICSPGFDSSCQPGDFAHTGFRIPLIVVSPWVKPHSTSHVVRETTSILKLIETRFGLPALTGRDAAADDMTEMFDFTQPNMISVPPLPQQPTNAPCSFNMEINGQQ
ncbi:MAG: alkaline phosphatase family protein [Terriglobales bacterium]